MSKHIPEVEQALSDMKDIGINLIRIGLLDDGRTIFDKEGYVIGYSDTFRRDVKIALDLAYEYQIGVEFVLVDYLVAQPSHDAGGLWIGWPQLINNKNIKQEFVNEFLKPFMKDFGNHDALMSIDVINEPEWLIAKNEGGGCDKDNWAIPRQYVDDFISSCIETINQEVPEILVTTGVSITYGELLRDLPVDYFAFHYYPWMGELDSRLNDVKTGVASLPLAKPWLLEEYPTKGTTVSLTSFLDSVLEMGGSGALFWNWTPGIDDSTSSGDRHQQQLNEFKNWVNTHSELISPASR